MSDYIKREDALNILWEWIPEYDEVIKEVKDIPSADVVDVCRCKDCRYIAVESDDEGTSYFWCNWIEHEVDENTYCAWAERRNDE